MALALDIALTLGISSITAVFLNLISIHVLTLFCPSLTRLFCGPILIYLAYSSNYGYCGWTVLLNLNVIGLFFF